MSEIEMNDKHVKRLNTLIARAQGVAAAVYHAPNINVDNASPRQVMSDIIDELVRMKRIYEAVPGIFDGPENERPEPFTQTKGQLQ